MSDSEQDGPARTSDARPPGHEEPTLQVAPPQALSAGTDTTRPQVPVAAPPPEPPPPGRVLAERYTVLELLGRGGMGTVVAAYDSRLDRRVALKLLHSLAGEGRELEQRARLLREAQAMARLNHPHVVSLYDAGTLEDGSIFLAMEHVSGQTLRGWARQAPRSWREVLAAYLEAGQGLAAAHEAGLVHRDFKPDNVLVGSDGRVRVTDFGVARMEEPLPTPVTPLLPLLSSDAWERAITLPGTVVGTPRYLAPELLQGRPADARSDLYSFCLALYEDLYGQRAFPGTSQREQLQARLEGRVSPPPARGPPVPGWVGRAVLRGLSAEPLQRPATMRQLLAALESDPETRRRERWRARARGTATALLVALCAALGWEYLQQRRGVCADMEGRLAGIWDEAVRARVRQALVDTGLPFALDTAERVDAALEAYASTWVRMRTHACEASRGTSQPRDLAVLEVHCLERRRSQLSALTGLLARGADSKLLEKATQSARSLPPLDDCEDPRALLATVPQPEDPAVRARAQALQEEVDRLEALQLAGRNQEALALGEALLLEVADVPHAPLRGWVRFWVAQARASTMDLASAEALLREAVSLAAHGQDDVLAAQAWSKLLWVVGYEQGRHAEAMGLALAVEAAADRSRDGVSQGMAINALGALLMRMGRIEESLGHYTRALALRREALGEEHLDVAGTLHNIAICMRELGRVAEARQHFEQSLAIKLKVLGEEHPLIAASFNSLGNVLREQGHPVQAQRHFERALELARRSPGSEHPFFALVLNNMGSNLEDLGRPEEALTMHERALAVRQKALRPGHTSVADSLGNMGDALMEMGRPVQARARYEQAVALYRKELAPEHPDLLLTLGRLGLAHVRLGEWEQASGLLRQALAWTDKGPASLPVKLAMPLLARGELHLARGQPAEALGPLERALALAQNRARLRAQVALPLAQALWTLGEDRPRAVALAREARAYYEEAGNAPALTQVTRWLATHSPSESHLPDGR